MYSAKHRASSPLVTGSSATSQVGTLTSPVRPAASMLSRMAVGLMSGEPVICSWVMVSCTSLRALAPV